MAMEVAGGAGVEDWDRGTVPASGESDEALQITSTGLQQIFWKTQKDRL